MEKQHYVPRHYLEGFVDPRSRAFNDPYLWVVDLREESVRKRSPKNTANLRGYYEWDDSDPDLPSLESLYSTLESRAAPALRKIASRRFMLKCQLKATLRCRHQVALTARERFDIARFVGFQLSRGPGFRGTAQDVLAKQGEEHLESLLSDDELLGESLKRYAQEKELDEPPSLEETKRWLGDARTRIQPSKDYILGLGVYSGDRFGRLLFVSKWVLFVARRGAQFFTTDEPAALLTPDAKPRPVDLDAASAPELEVAFPVSADCMLHFHQGQMATEVLGLHGSAVDLLMSRSHLPTMQRFAFCSSEEQGRWVLSQRKGRVKWPEH